MASSTTETLAFIGKQITIYGGFIIVGVGVLGNLLTIIVFLSLETFRKKTCAFYLIILSFVNIGQLVFGLLSRIMISGFDIDWTSMSYSFCKCRLTLLQFCSLMSYTCLCLAIIDQYFATCSNVRWQQWNHMKFAYRLVFVAFILSVLMMLPFAISLQFSKSSTGKMSCNLNTVAMLQYRNYVFVPFVTGLIPDIIAIIFAIMAYRNVQQLTYRTVPIIRRELDKQLTKMVLSQVVTNFFTNVPGVAMIAVVYATSTIKDVNITNIIQFIYSISNLLFYAYFMSSFYIYISVSERFRRQFKYVLFDKRIHRWAQFDGHINQVNPI